MKKIFLLLGLVLISGCASVKVALYNEKIHYPATDPRSIEIFQKKPEDRKFIEIGEITVDGASNMEQAERIFRIKAAEYGGNAVYVYKTIEQQRTYVYPRECYYYDGFAYPRGYGFPRMHYYPRHYRNFPRYYYCYGYDDIQTATFLMVIGIVIRYA